MTKKNVLFLCTGNSCRSQMAEGWARLFHGDKIEAFSAGIEAHGMNPNAMQVMKEAGVDISGQSSKLASSLTDIPLDLVITVCGHADENCPAFLTKAKLVHVGFDDPPKLAKEAASEEAALDCYRRVRDEICDFVRDKLSALIAASQNTGSVDRITFTITNDEEAVPSSNNLPGLAAPS